MSIRGIWFFLIFLSFLTGSIAQEIGFPIIRNYAPKEYNNSPQVWSAVQDSRGIMYFGTNSGAILEYDGVIWRNISINNNAIPYDLSVDSIGRIYVGASNEFGYLTADQFGNTQYQSLTHLVTDTTCKISDVRFIRFTTHFVYFFSYNAIFQYEPKNETLSIFKANASDRFYGDFVYNDTYYARLINNGLVKIVNDAMVNASQADFFKKKYAFREALSFGSEKVFIPTRTDGLYVYQPEKDSVPFSFSISNNDFLTNNDIYHASLFQKEYLVLGSLNKGAALLNNEGTLLQQFNENSFLQSNSIYTIQADYNQNIWFGLSNGISKTESGFDLSYLDKKAGLNGTVLSIIRFRGTLYIATDTKLYYIDATKQLREIKNIPVGQNWSFLEFKTPTQGKDENKNLLLLGTSTGIYEIKGDETFQIYKGTSHAFKVVQSIKNPSIIYSTDYPYFVSIRFENGKWINEGLWEGINDNIRGIIEDENGDIWLGTINNGITRITPNSGDGNKSKKVLHYALKQGLPSVQDVLPFYYKEKIIWGTTKGLSIYNSTTDRFEPFCELGETFCNGSRSIFSLTEMPDGKIWIHSEETKNADIGYLKPNAKGGYDWIYAPFRRIPEMFMEAFYAEPSGTVWFGGNEGLFRYDMGKDTRKYDQPFECLIRKVTAGLDSLLYGGSVDHHAASTKLHPYLKYNLNTLTFEYAAPYFDQEDRTMCSYQLIGFDKEWSKWSTQFKKEYTNLFEGTYTFQVKARNIYDVESNISKYTFTIKPPYYRTWWAYVIYFTLTVLFILTLLKIYTKRLVTQKKELEKTIAEKTAEVVAQKNELQASNEELTASNEELHNQREELSTTLAVLKETQQQLVQAEKMASLGVLSAGIAHEINNPLNYIHGGILAIETYLKETNPEQLNDVGPLINAINVGVKRATDIVTSMNHYSQNNSLVTSECDVHHIMDDCLIMLHNQFKNKIILRKQYTIESCLINGNEGKLHQAFLNLLSNAEQAIKGKGIIEIVTEVVQNTLTITIADSGEGISADNLQKIFDPFFTTKAPGKGTGLGLSITFTIIKEHQGILEYESEQSVGTKAIIKLPIIKT